jgi:alanine racemase
MSTLITVDLDALQRNFRACAQRLQPADCAAVVKANAYGLGIAEIAPALARAGCRQFFTATHREGVTLRSLLPEVEIFVFEGVTGNSVRAFLEHGLVPVLISPQTLEAWVAAARSAERELPAIFHIDTGMTRLGFGEHEMDEALAGDALDWLDLRYVMTHFACADEPRSSMPDEQLERFDRLRRRLPGAPTSIGNSAGSLRGPRYAAPDTIGPRTIRAPTLANAQLLPELYV